MTGRFQVLILALALLVGTVPALCNAAGPGDDWEIIDDQKLESPALPSNPTRATAPAAVPDSTAGDQALVACGERARAAQEPYVSIVATLNHLANSDAPVYESVASNSPHARSGGCIFYNRDYLAKLTRNWMGIQDPDQLQTMLYAIFAHELGHVVHGDLSGRRAAEVPVETKELEADRFAGYMMGRLDIPRFDAAQTEFYYEVIGDDFVGVHGSHGTGKQRTGAFQDGWDQARIGLPESTARPAGGLESDSDSARGN